MRQPLRVFLATLVAMLLGASARAEVVKLVVQDRQPLAGAAEHYEKLTGRFFGELDPHHPLNAVITDIELAPRNARGMVEYSGTFTILKPTGPTRASGVLVYSVANRGTSGIAGAGFWADFRAAGHVLVASGWQADLAAAPSVEALVVPVAKYPDGSTITAPVVVRFVDMAPGASTVEITRGRSTGTANPSTLDTTRATLTRRSSEDGVRTVIAPDAWRFADCGRAPFPGIADPLKVCLKGGFDPAYLYELSYIAKDPPVLGIGFAATRDLLSFLRRSSSDNPLEVGISHVIAQGTSQSGTFLRSFVHLGFNQDERGRQVIDGMNVNLAARQLAMNIRFAAPGGGAGMFEPGSDGVVWWEADRDEARGGPPSALLARCRATASCPHIVETFGSSEFYSHRASPMLVGTRADHDIPLPPNVRRYFIAGVRHGGGPGGFAVTGRRDPCCVMAVNDNSSSEIHRALMKALVDWVVHGTAPPPSRYPTLARGELSPPNHVAMGFPAIPGNPLPDGVITPFYDYEFGPEYRGADASGVISQPPSVRGVLPMLVPRVDADGNETAGVRSVLLQVPLGTYTGWNPLAGGFSKGRIQTNGGGYIPFARTKKERLDSGDPRLSLEERYGTHDAYVARVRQAAVRLVDDGFMLDDDARRLIDEADKSAVLR